MSRKKVLLEDFSARYLLDFVESVLGFAVPVDCFVAWFYYCRLHGYNRLSRSMVKRSWNEVFLPLGSSMEVEHE